jgi:hypothetical protein
MSPRSAAVLLPECCLKLVVLCAAAGATGTPSCVVHFKGFRMHAYELTVIGIASTTALPSFVWL